MIDHNGHPMAEEAPFVPPGPVWRSFAAGCRAVRIGLLIELAAVAGTLALLAYPAARALLLSREIDDRMPPGLKGPRAWLPLAAILFLGAVVTAVGRLRMAALPAGTGARGVLAVAAGLTASRAIVLGFAGAALLVSAGVPPAGDWRRVVASLFPWALGAAVTAGLLADVAAIQGMALVAGTVPSARLRRAAGRVAGFVLLVAAVLWPVGMATLYLLRMWERRDPKAPPRIWQDLDLGWVMVFAILAWFGLLALEVAYTRMQYGLYSTARAAVRLTPNPG